LVQPDQDSEPLSKEEDAELPTAEPPPQPTTPIIPKLAFIPGNPDDAIEESNEQGQMIFQLKDRIKKQAYQYRMEYEDNEKRLHTQILKVR
jgi:hypothetical protein